MNNENQSTRERSIRVAISDMNMKRINIIKNLIPEEVELMNDREAIYYIVNKAIEKYYKSDEIQSKIREL